MTTLTDLAVEYCKMPGDAQQRLMAELPTLLAHIAERYHFHADLGLVMSAEGTVWKDDGIDTVTTR